MSEARPSPFDFTLHRRLDELDGTLYFELLPGRYAGRCWGPSSVFMAEETFTLLEPLFRRRWPAFSHYAFADIPGRCWETLLVDLDELGTALLAVRSSADLPADLGYLRDTSRAAFAAEPSRNSVLLANLIKETQAWVRQALSTHDAVAVLGI